MEGTWGQTEGGRGTMMGRWRGELLGHGAGGAHLVLARIHAELELGLGVAIVHPDGGAGSRVRV